MAKGKRSSAVTAAGMIAAAVVLGLAFPSVGHGLSPIWNLDEPMPVLLGGVAVARHASTIYAAGGRPYYPQPTTNSLWAFDTKTSTWTSKTPMPTDRMRASAIMLGGRIYVLGGTRQGGTVGWASSSAVEAYDPATDTWTSATNMNCAGSQLATAVLDGKIYAMGRSATNYYNYILEVYDAAVDTWTIVGSHPNPSWGITAAALDGKVYLAGDSWFSVYSPETNTWQNLANIPGGRRYSAAVAMCGRIYLVGGQNNLNQLDGTVLEYNPQTDTWAKKSSLIYPRSSLGVAVLDNRIYAVAGATVGQLCGIKGIVEVGHVCDCQGLPDLSVAKNQTPANPDLGQPVTYRIVAANSGSATIGSFIVVDTVPPLVAVTEVEYPTHFPPPVVMPSPEGTVYAWGGGNIELPPRTVYTFTITGTVTTSVCTPEEASVAAMAMGTGPCEGILALSEPVKLTVIPLDYRITKEQSPEDPGVGDTIQYRIQVVNTGGGPLEGLTVVDTIPGILDNASWTIPAGFSASFRPSPEGTVVTWTAVNPVPAGGSVVFHETATVANPCAATRVESRATAHVPSTCRPDGIRRISERTGFSLTAQSLGITVAQTVSPAQPSAGDRVTFSFVITNNGAVTVTNLVLVDTLPEQVTFVGQASVPALYHFRPTDRLHVWQAPLGLRPRQSVTITIETESDACFTGEIHNTGVVAAHTECGVLEVVATEAFTPIYAAPALSMSQELVNLSKGGISTAFSPGDRLRYTITVANTGTGTAFNVRLVDTLPAGKLRNPEVLLPPGWHRKPGTPPRSRSARTPWSPGRPRSS